MEVKLKAKLKGTEARSLIRALAENAPGGGKRRDPSGFVARAIRKTMPRAGRRD